MRALVLCALGACTSDVRLEAERALAGGEHVRQLTVAEQSEALRTLGAVSCADRDVCLVKEKCSAVARPTLAALEHREGARPDIALVRGDAAPEAIEAARARADALLSQAHDELELGKQAVPECEAGLAILARSIKGK